MREQITKQKHPSPCFSQEPCPGQEEAAARPLCPSAVRRGAAQAQPRQSRGGPAVTASHHARRWQGPRARPGGCFTVLPAAPCETNTHYPCCSTLRIEAQLAARAAHLPAPAAPRSAPRPSSATRGWRRHHRAGQVWPGPSVKAGPCLRRLSCLRAQRSRQRQILQLLQLAQAASDYLKPQPFFYERRAQTLDRSIATCSDGSRDHWGSTALLRR